MKNMADNFYHTCFPKPEINKAEYFIPLPYNLNAVIGNSSLFLAQ